MPTVRLLLALLLLAPATSLAQDDDVPPPEIRWKRGPNVLTVQVLPQGETHIAPDLPIEIRLDDGGHFIIRWTEANLPEAGRATIKIPRVAAPESTGWSLQVSGGVCNDDGSICLPFHAEAELAHRGPGAGRLMAEPGRPPTSPPLVDAGQDPRVVDAAMLPPGARWYHATEPGETDAAILEARALGKNLLVDFYAQWCPPCDRLRDEFLEDPRQLGLLGEFVLLKADADNPASFDLKNEYQVGGYPTLLVLDQYARELDRITGYDGRTDRLAERLRASLGDDGEDPRIKSIRLAVAAGDNETAWTEFRALMDTYSGVEPDYDLVSLGLQAGRRIGTPEELALLHVQAAARAPLPGLAAHHAESAASAYDEVGDKETAASIRADYAARLSANVAVRSPADVVLGRGWTSISGALVRHDAGLHDDVALGTWYRADWVDEEAGRQLLAEGALRIAAAILFEESAYAPELPVLEDARVSVAIPDHLLTERMKPRLAHQGGRVHDLVDLLNKAGLPDVNEPILDAMVELFPDDFTWHYKRSAFLRDHREGVGALDAAQLALERSYGDNRLRAARRVAELLIAEERMAEAIAVIDEALASPAPEQEHVRTHRYRTALQTLRAEHAPDPDEEAPR